MVRKEMLTTLKDPKSRIILIMPVIIQSLLFGYVASYNLDSVDYAVLDLSRSRYLKNCLPNWTEAGYLNGWRHLEAHRRLPDSSMGGK